MLKIGISKKDGGGGGGGENVKEYYCMTFESIFKSKIFSN